MDCYKTNALQINLFSHRNIKSTIKPYGCNIQTIFLSINFYISFTDSGTFHLRKIRGQMGVNPMWIHKSKLTPKVKYSRYKHKLAMVVSITASFQDVGKNTNLTEPPIASLSRIKSGSSSLSSTTSRING